MATAVKPEPKIKYGPQLDTNVPNLFEPQTVKQYTPPPAGIDNLGITSVDTFKVPGVGEFTVEFTGYVRVVRSKPTTDDWASTEVYTNLIEMRMEGESPQLGPITVTLNSECLSTGMIRTPFDAEEDAQPAKACRMAVGAVFELSKLGLKLFNKEPVLLTIDDVRSIPPAGNPGKGQIYQMLPLYDMENADAEPVAFLTSLSFRMGTYLPEAKQDR
jgi:hypothetical protein